MADRAAPLPGPAPVGGPAAFREVMSRYATGVVAVTTVLDGLDLAMTANSFSSVSLDPMLALVCVARGSRFHDAVLAAGVWGISVLGRDDEALARRLATKGRPAAGQLDGVAVHRGRTGAALLDSALASLECATAAVHRAGDHDVIIGEVIGLGPVNPAGLPLVYWGHRFGLPDAPEGPDSP